MDHLNDFHFWPALSRYEADGSLLSFHLTKGVGNGHIDGRHQVAVSVPDFPFWSWLHEIRHSIPPYFEVKYLHSLRHHFNAGKREIKSPENGLYLITADWSGPARAIETALRAKLALRKLSIPVYFIKTESEEVDRMLPQLRPFLHGWGEAFLFINGRCDLFFSSKDGVELLSSNIQHIFQKYAD